MTLKRSRMRMTIGLAVLLALASCVPPGTRLARHSAPVHALASAPVPERKLPAALPQMPPPEPFRFAVDAARPALPFRDDARSAADQLRSLYCLTAAVYYEARSESEDGQRAVAQVVLNRVRHPAFPATVCGVVFQGSERSTGCQFTFTCDGSIRSRPEPAGWDRARRIAADALAGEVYAPVGQATHYHTRAVLPYWSDSLTRSAMIGAHIFYRWRGSQGETSAFRQRYAGMEPSLAAEEPRSALPSVTRNVWRGDDGESVTIHRGSATRPAPEMAEDSGVRIHRGSVPLTLG